MRLGIGVAAFMVLAFVSCSDDAAQDEVVNAILRCEWPEDTSHQEFGAACNEKWPPPPTSTGTYKNSNRRLEVSVRTPPGTTYTIDLEPDAAVRIGDPWP